MHAMMEDYAKDSNGYMGLYVLMKEGLDSQYTGHLTHIFEADRQCWI